jgi:hypothetical protein
VPRDWQKESKEVYMVEQALDIQMKAMDTQKDGTEEHPFAKKHVLDWQSLYLHAWHCMCIGIACMALQLT